MAGGIYRPRAQYEGDFQRRKRKSLRMLAAAQANTVTVTWTLASTDLTGPIGSTPLDAPSAFTDMGWTIALVPLPVEVTWSLDDGLADFDAMAWTAEAVANVEVQITLVTTTFPANLIGVEGINDAAGFGEAVWDVRVTGQGQGRNKGRTRIGIGIGIGV